MKEYYLDSKTHQIKSRELPRFYRDTETGDLFTIGDLQAEFKEKVKAGEYHALQFPKYMDECLKCTLEDVTDLYMELSERFIWSDDSEKHEITLETAEMWLEAWQDDYDEFGTYQVNPFTVNAGQIVDVWNHLVREEAE